MKQITDAHLPADAVRRWAEAFSCPEHVQNSENFVYRFRTGDPARSYYLRLTHDQHRSHEQILAELNFVRYLAQEGCPVSSPVPSRRGHLIEPLVSHAILLHACVFEAAPGTRVQAGSAAWNQPLFHRWGLALGAIHAASRRFVPSGAKRFRWDEDDVWINAGSLLPLNETAARRELERVQSWLAMLRHDESNFGLIHGDLCCANFHDDGQEITAFDFDDCVYHWFVYDLVCALAPVVFHPERRDYRRWMIEGYQQANPLSPMWEAEFDWFLRLRGLYLFILNVRDWPGSVEEHPKSRFLNALRQSFEQPIRW